MQNVMTVQDIRQEEARPHPAERLPSWGGLAPYLATVFAVVRPHVRSQRHRRWRVSSGEQRPQIHSVDYLAQNFPYHYGPGVWS